MTFAAPNPPFIAARFHGGAQTPKAIVIHATVSPDRPGTARNIANWWAGPTSPVTSATYVVDPKEVIQCVGDHTVAYHCGYNTGTIGIELCDEQTGPASRWKDANSTAIINHAATLVAQLCLAYGISPTRPTVAQLKAQGPHGIYGHNDSRLAFGYTDHTDPKDFDWPGFMAKVRAEVNRLKGVKPPVAPKPTPVPPKPAPKPVPKPPATPTVNLNHLIAARKHDAPAPGPAKLYPAEVLILEKALQAEGLLAAKYVDGSYGTTTVTAVAALQRKMGYKGKDADGTIGSSSLAYLAKRHGFKVV